MKRILSSLCMLLIAGVAFGQAHEGSVELQKSDQPAAVIELPYPPGIVSAALNDYLSKKGKLRADDLKGFTTFRNTQPIVSDSMNADLYLKVERKSRSEKETSIISLLLTEPTESVATNPAKLRYLNMEQAKAYLNDLAFAVQAYNLELQIKEQNEALTRAESKYKSLADEGADLEKKRTSLEKKIQDNKQEQQTQMVEIENQKQKLASWVAQRKS